MNALCDREDKTTKRREPLHDILRRILNEPERQLDLRLFAQRLHVPYRTLMYWLSGERKLPAVMISSICNLLDDHKLLDQLEEDAGRVAYRVPHHDQSAAKDVRTVQRLIKEVGEALEELAKTLEDGIVEEHEVERTSQELDDVIRECAALKHWLRQRCETDKLRLKISLASRTAS